LGTDRVFNRKFSTRLLLVFGASIFVFLIVSLRLIDLAVSEDDLAEEIKRSFDRVFTLKIPLYRGSLQDANGKDLALSVPTLSLYAHPNTSLLKNKDKLVEELSRITGLSKKEIRKRMDKGKNKPVKILSGVSRDLKRELKALIRATGNTSYLGIQEEYRRLYPNGTLASNLIGFVGVDGIGLEGMEFMLNEHLGGGYSTALMYANGGMGKVFLHPLQGSLGKEKDVLLTVDLGVQMIIERIRNSIVKKWRPKRVAILVMDLSNGHILGLTTYPYFDPNRFYKYPPRVRKNHAVTDPFEPGSIMKPFFVGWALDKGYITTDMWIDTGKGVVEVFDRKVRDPKRLGTISVREVLIHSSNVGTIKIAQNLNKKEVEKLLDSFHLNKRFKIFPGEANPQIPDLNYPANLLYISIGQGIALNTLNIAVAFGGLATGRIIKPQIVKEVVSSEGKVVYRAEEEILRNRVLSEKTVRWLRRTLIDVVEKGTGRRAKSKYFYIAGKTGTAQKYDPRAKAYSKDKVIVSFAGFFPASNPRFVGVIVVDEPKGKKLYGGVVSAPYFKELAEQVAFYYGLKPDKLK